MATMSRNPPQTTSNGVITAPPKGMIGGNRKKQKRRAKQAAKAASQAVQPRPDDAHADDIDYDEDPLVYAEEDEYEYSEAENQQYDAYPPDDAQGRGSYDMPPPSTVPGKKNKKKKKKAGGAPTDAHALYSSDMLTTSRLPDLPSAPTAVDRKGPNNVQHQQNIWNTTTQQERQNIKNFWLSLSEDERKSLLKIEKETVLRKMKQQQQKHSCQCTVCGRKRTAIEEELEVLYEGYYEELEQYAHHDHPHPTSRNLLPAPLAHSHAQHPLATPHPNLHSHHRSSQMLEHLDDDEDEEDEDDYEEEEEGEDSGDEYSEEEDEDDFSDEEVELARPPVPDFFNFGQNLTVKDNLLTVADDLLKNDGRKFIEMMEQLAERRMQRETEAEFAAANPAHSNNYHNNDGYGNDESMGPDDEFDDEEGSYDSQEYDEDELDDEDEMSGLTEEQRMQEGRRMFQIFAARMFEHRVLTAYKEKVAAERQRKLLEELQDEEKLEAQREAKKKRDAEKKKDKKRQQQAAKAEERAKKEAEKAAEEARLKEAEEKKHEEQRRKKEEQRKKKEEEKRKLEEERLRKEAEKTRRQQEEQQRREDAERKAREQKALEKSRKEEARKREKEEREAKEKALRDRKSEEERAKASKEVKATTKEADTPSELKAQQPPQIVKRPSQPSMVAVPGVFAKQQPQAQQSTPASVSSPKSSVAMPAVPKASTAAKPKLPSQQGSHASSPKQAQSQVSSGPSKSSSPGSLPPQAIPQSISIPPKPVIQKPVVSQHAPQGHQQHGLPPHLQQIQPPPGMLHPYQQQQHPHHNFAMPPAGYPNFQTPSPGGLSAGIRPSPMFNQGPPPVSIPGRVASFGAPSMNGMPGPHSAGMVGMHGRGGFPFDSPGGASPNAPPGFGPQTAQISPTSLPLSANLSVGSDNSRAPLNHAHSRQQSMSEKPFDPAVAQPITRPAPIKRPTSIKAQDNSDVDDLSKHLGSSALLGDDEDDVLNNRQRGPFDNLGSFRGNAGGFGAPGGWNATSPFGQSNSLGQQWGGLPQSSISDWNSNGGFASTSSGFGSIGSASGMHRGSALASNRPLTIRIAVCQACKQLSSMSPGSGNDFHDVNALVRQIELNRPPLEALPTLKEIEDICETEGDAQNGGGELQIRKSGISMLAVRWQPDATTPDLGRGAAIGSLGEIGSPMPGKSTPAFGFGAPGMGRSNTGSIGHWPNSGL